MIELRVDPEFQNKIPPLTEAEFEQLKENILSDGEVYEPLVVWNGTIVDGHNRYKIVQEHPEIPYRVKEMDFPDKWAAFDWMYKKQLGRRNLTDEQRTVLIGKMYEARKQSVTNEKGINQHTKVVDGQNDQQPKQNTTAEAIAQEIGVGETTVRRAALFSQGIDALSAVSQEAADKILKGGSGALKKDVMELRHAEPETLTEFAEAVISGTVKENSNRKKPVGWTKEDRERRSLTERIVADMYNPDSVPEYTLEMFVEEIQLNSKNYIDLLRTILKERSTLLTKENRPIIADTIENDVIKEIQKIKELIVS